MTGFIVVWFLHAFQSLGSVLFWSSCTYMKQFVDQLNKAVAWERHHTAVIISVTESSGRGIVSKWDTPASVYGDANSTDENKSQEEKRESCRDVNKKKTVLWVQSNAEKVFKPCYISGALPRLHLYQHMWDFCWKKWHWTRFFSESFAFCPVRYHSSSAQ
jgi:hypothetical protein